MCWIPNLINNFNYNKNTLTLFTFVLIKTSLIKPQINCLIEPTLPLTLQYISYILILFSSIIFLLPLKTKKGKSSFSLYYKRPCCSKNKPFFLMALQQRGEYNNFLTQLICNHSDRLLADIVLFFLLFRSGFPSRL